MTGLINTIIEYAGVFLAVIVALTLHEFAHAFSAVKSGDPTPRLYGRYTLNPLAHFDPIGLVMLLIVHFGWAKPVPVNPYNFKNYKRGCFWVSVAGVLCNYIQAFVFYPLLLLFYYVQVKTGADFGYGGALLHYFLLYSFYINLGLIVFNLIPVYPLDGFRVVDLFAKRRGKLYLFLRNRGYYMLLALIVWSWVTDYLSRVIPIFEYLDILNLFMLFARNILAYPITAFWGLIF